ncbi:hypothetical protein BDR26DRAFT_891717 [Obelidium mucronatum]|nr:hypothetical protein BDR26DRAFT_891717 [Obelidium mucronatum]
MEQSSKRRLSLSPLTEGCQSRATATTKTLKQELVHETDPYMRRTIQNRIAQRLYRQRKDNKIRELEAQLAELEAGTRCVKQEGTHSLRSADADEAAKIKELETRVTELETENYNLKAGRYRGAVPQPAMYPHPYVIGLPTSTHPPTQNPYYPPPPPSSYYPPQSAATPYPPYVWTPYPPGAPAEIVSHHTPYLNYSSSTQQQTYGTNYVDAIADGLNFSGGTVQLPRPSDLMNSQLSGSEPPKTDHISSLSSEAMSIPAKMAFISGVSVSQSKASE